MSRRHHSSAPPPPPLPSGYQPLNYIEGQGRQYINCGISAPNGFISNGIVSIKLQSYTNPMRVIGSHNTGSPYGRNGLAIQCDNSNKKWQLSHGDYFPSTPNGTLVVDQIYTYTVCSYRGNGYLDIDGTRVLTDTTNTTLSSNNICIFFDNYLGTYKCLKGKVYYADLTINGILVREYYPALRILDTTAGLYDIVYNQFYTNAGTGTFLFG